MRLPTIRPIDDTTLREDRKTLESKQAWSKRKVALNLVWHAGLAVFAVGVFYFGWVI